MELPKNIQINTIRVSNRVRTFYYTIKMVSYYVALKRIKLVSVHKNMTHDPVDGDRERELANKSESSIYAARAACLGAHSIRYSVHCERDRDREEAFCCVSCVAVVTCCI